MLNKFTKGIVAKIHNDLGDNGNKYKYYEDGISQNFQTPCFYPHPLDQYLIKRAGGGYEYNISFAVHYFPEDPKNNRDKNEMGCFLLNSLETITIDISKLGVSGEYVGKQLVRGNEIHFEVQEDRVVCEVTYRLLTQLKPSSVDEMTSLLIAENAK